MIVMKIWWWSWWSFQYGKKKDDDIHNNIDGGERKRLYSRMKRSRMHCKDFLPLRVIGKVADDVAATIASLV